MTHKGQSSCMHNNSGTRERLYALDSHVLHEQMMMVLLEANCVGLRYFVWSSGAPCIILCAVLRSQQPIHQLEWLSALWECSKSISTEIMSGIGHPIIRRHLVLVCMDNKVPTPALAAKLFRKILEHSCLPLVQILQMHLLAVKGKQ